MSNVIHLISDLHLCHSKPNLLSLFQYYMNEIAPTSNQLFVLGDLFDMWVGDDHHSALAQQVIDLFKTYTANNSERKIYFAHGNRDFLIGDQFANECGGQLIQEPHHFNWQDKKISLMHGDILCTDDIKYQQFRAAVRDPSWQKNFLAQSIENRLAYAANVKKQSKAEQQTKQAIIMDVNQQAVNEFFAQHQCDWLIHGHTHREGSHTVEFNKNKELIGNNKGRNETSLTAGTRIVLSDWDTQGHYLALQQGKAISHYFSPA